MKTQALVTILMPPYNVDAPRVQSNLKKYRKGDGVTPFLVHLKGFWHGDGAKKSP